MNYTNRVSLHGVSGNMQPKNKMVLLEGIQPAVLRCLSRCFYLICVDERWGRV
jgi:hypothetical protein